MAFNRVNDSNSGSNKGINKILVTKRPTGYYYYGSILISRLIKSYSCIIINSNIRTLAIGIDFINLEFSPTDTYIYIFFNHHTYVSNDNCNNLN